MKRTAALVILAALLLQTLSVTGCAERELRRTGYDFLSDAGKAFYDYADSVYNGSSPAVFGEDYGLNAFEMSEIVDIYSDDHPEVFWIDERYNLSGEKGRYELRACVGGAELDEMKRELEAAVSSVLSGIGPRASDYEKELYIHDFLTDSVEYTEELYEPVGDDGSYTGGFAKTAYGALVEGSANCHGFARAFHLLCQRAGVQSAILQGDTLSGDSHCWNAVQLGKNWYHVDVTHDSSAKATLELLRYAYFNVSDAAILQTRTIRPLYSFSGRETWYNSFVPECGKDDRTYYAESGALAEYSGSIDATVKRMTPHNGWWMIRIGDGLDFDTQREQLPSRLIKRMNALRGTHYSTDCGVYFVRFQRILLIEAKG